MRTFWEQFVESRRGAISILAASTIVIAVGFAALAADLGSVFLQTRQLQGIADLAAVSAANDLSDAQAAAEATANANGWKGRVTVNVATGVYTPDPSLAVNQRFTPNGGRPNAAQVTLSAPAQLFFGAVLLGKPTIPITRTATAAQAQLASFSIGSGLLALQGGIENSLLSALTGSQVQLDAMSYQALVSANINLLDYSKALQTNLNMKGATFNQVLSSHVTTGQALAAMASVLNANGQTNAGRAINQIASAAGGSIPANMQQLINLGPYGAQDHANPNSGAGIQVSALQMTNALLELAQGGHQVQLSLGTSVPGLAQTDVWLAIGQRPSNSSWLTVTDDGSNIVSTAQMRLYIQATALPAGGALGGLGVSALSVPIYVEMASAEGKLTAITCPTAGTPEQVTLAADPSVGQIALGQVDLSQLTDFTAPVTIHPANLISLPLLTATGSANVHLGGGDWQPLTFNASDIQNQTVKTVSTNNIAQATVASLLGATDLQVRVAGLNVGTGPVLSSLQSTLSTAAVPLDATLNALTSLVGVQLGQASLWVDGVRCGNAALVA